MQSDRLLRALTLAIVVGSITGLSACGKKAAAPPASTAPTPVAQRFVISADEQSVTDTRTRLVWKRCVEGRKLLMKACLGDTRLIDRESIDHFVSQEAAPDGWRLPTANELGTIIEARYPEPDMKLEYHFDSELFPPPLIDAGMYYWLGDSSGKASGAVMGWYVFDGQLMGHSFGGSAPAFVRLVRNAR